MVAGCAAGVVAYGLAYSSARLGAVVIIIGVAFLLAAYNHGPA